MRPPLRLRVSGASTPTKTCLAPSGQQHEGFSAPGTIQRRPWLHHHATHDSRYMYSANHMAGITHSSAHSVAQASRTGSTSQGYCNDGCAGCLDGGNLCRARLLAVGAVEGNDPGGWQQGPAGNSRAGDECVPATLLGVRYSAGQATGALGAEGLRACTVACMLSAARSVTSWQQVRMVAAVLRAVLLHACTAVLHQAGTGHSCLYRPSCLNCQHSAVLSAQPQPMGHSSPWSLT